MFYDDNPLSNLLSIGMFGLSYFVGHQSGKSAALMEMEARAKENEVQALRRQVEELSRKINSK